MPTMVVNAVPGKPFELKVTKSFVHFRLVTCLVYVAAEHRASTTGVTVVPTQTSFPFTFLQVNVPLFVPAFLHAAPAIGAEGFEI